MLPPTPPARALKLKLTGEAELDAARVRAVRARCPQAWIGVDANQGYTAGTLPLLLPVLVEANVSLLEQPCVRGRESDLDGIERPLPFAADESILDLTELEARHHRFDVINIKLDKCGGLTEGLMMARRARELGKRVMVGNMCGTSPRGAGVRAGPVLRRGRPGRADLPQAGPQSVGALRGRQHHLRRRGLGAEGDPVNTEADKTWFGQPRGLTILFLTNMWELFSYYGMRTLLVYYMTKQLLFAQEKASFIYGTYTAMAYFTPIFGGMVADRWLGKRNAVVIGATIMAFGHFVMAFESMFYVALATIALGNGLFLPSLPSQINDLYAADDPRRGRAYNVYYVGLNIGGFLTPLVCGTLGELYGWHYGFGAAGVGMFLAYGDLPRRAPLPAAGTGAPHERGCRPRAGAREQPPGLAAAARGRHCGHDLPRRVRADRQYAAAVDRYRRGPRLGRLDHPDDLVPVAQPAAGDLDDAAAAAGVAASRGSRPRIVAGHAHGDRRADRGRRLCAAGRAGGGDRRGAGGVGLAGRVLRDPDLRRAVHPADRPAGLFARLAPPRLGATTVASWFLAVFSGSLLAGAVGTLWSRASHSGFFLLLSGLTVLAALLLWRLDRPIRALE